ncbi:hypothetical protein EV11_0219 [Prochlorococcus sp. SS52]|nr:hypothetical protein EV04_0130 [Prochlorococcus marinus str. LG]KGG37344.1 hypothetical protein EV11_0219 [Prochlorococcus sp. SS52]
MFLSFLALFLANAQVVYAANQVDMKNTDTTVIEYLRLKVSDQERRAWLTAEKKSWEPWLKEQKGFLGRQLLWNPQKQEAILLISWATREDWKRIPQEEIDKIQKLFEEIAKDLTGETLSNPFPIKAQGELFPQ